MTTHSLLLRDDETQICRYDVETKFETQECTPVKIECQGHVDCSL